MPDGKDKNDCTVYLTETAIHALQEYLSVRGEGSGTIYVGRVYEEDRSSGGTVTHARLYYPAGGALRIDGTLYYVLKDHLGSASVVTDFSGNILTNGQQRYYPFGEKRTPTGTMLTDRLYTGQRDTGLGIYYYNARFYSPSINQISRIAFPKMASH